MLQVTPYEIAGASSEVAGTSSEVTGA